MDVEAEHAPRDHLHPKRAAILRSLSFRAWCNLVWAERARVREQATAAVRDLRATLLNCPPTQDELERWRAMFSPKRIRTFAAGMKSNTALGVDKLAFQVLSTATDDQLRRMAEAAMSQGRGLLLQTP